MNSLTRSVMQHCNGCIILTYIVYAFKTLQLKFLTSFSISNDHNCYATLGTIICMHGLMHSAML